MRQTVYATVMTDLEWQLEEAANEGASYQFANINPKLVFLLALAAGILAVAVIYLGYTAITLLIDAGLIPQPPRLQGLVD